MPNTKSKAKTKDVGSDYVRMYYEHQYDRLNKYQEQSINVSNIVLTISTLIITFGFGNRQSLGAVLILFLPLIVISANLFAILFVAYGRRRILLHQLRAKRVLETYAFDLYEIDKESTEPRGISRRRIQSFIHYLFILFGLILLILFVLELVGVSIV